MPIYMKMDSTYDYRLESVSDDAFIIDWLAEDHLTTDPSNGLKPTESLLPMESLRVDPSDPSLDPLIAELKLAAETTGGGVEMETLTIVHEGWELVL